MILDIDQFRNYKQRLITASQNNIEEYTKIFNELISYNLSQIPANEWEGIFLYSPAILDMSNTHANLDFTYFESIDCEKIILDGCNVQHLERISYDRDIFTDEFISSHPELFPSKDLPPEILNRFYNKNLIALDYLQCPELKDYSYYSSNKDDISILIRLFGLTNAVNFVNENKDFFLNNDYLNLFQLTNVPDSVSYEDGKKIIYDFIIQSEPSYLVYFYKTIPNDYKKLHPDIFIDERSLSEEFVNKYYSKRLELMDVKNNYEILKDKNRKVFLQFAYQLENLDFEQLVQMPDGIVKAIDFYLKDHIISYPITFEEEKIKEYLSYSISSINMNNISVKDVASYIQILEPKEIKELVKDKDASDFLNLWNIPALVEYSRDSNNILDEKITANGYTKSISLLLLEYLKEKYEYIFDKEDDDLDFGRGYLAKYLKSLPLLFNHNINTTIDEFLLSLYLDKDKKYSNPSNEIVFGNIKERISNYLLDEELLADSLKDVQYSDDIKENIVNSFYSDFYELAYHVNSATFYSKNPDILKSVFMNKKLTCRDLPLIDLFDDNDLNDTKYYERIYDVMSKYGVLIYQMREEYQLLKELWPLFKEDNYEELVNDFIEKEILVKEPTISESNGIILSKGRLIDNSKSEIYDFSALPESFTSKHPELILDEDAPDLLQDCFYDDPSALFILFTRNPDWRKYILTLDFNQLIIHRRSDSRDVTGPINNFVAFLLEKSFDNDTILDYLEEYGAVINRYGIYSDTTVSMFYHSPNETFIEDFNSKQELEEYIKNGIVKQIQNGHKYDDRVYEYVGSIIPEAFLPLDIDPAIKEKFYLREFDVQDFIDDPSLIDKLGNVNIVYGFNYRQYSWLADLFTDYEDKVSANRIRLQIMYEYEMLDNSEAKEFIRSELINNPDIEVKDIHELFGLITRLKLSNSIELQSFAGIFAKQLIGLEDKYKKIEDMEKIFVRNNLPLFGKVFLCFQKLYPVLSEVSYSNGQQRFRFDESSRTSPQLKDDSIPSLRWIKDDNTKRMAIIFNDLLRIAYRSNERSLMEYISNIEYGDAMYKAILSGRIHLEDIPDQFKDKLEVFVEHLEMLYLNTQKGKVNQISFDGMSLEERLFTLSKLLDNNTKFDLRDRIVRTFCYVAQINTFAELKQLVKDSQREQKERKDRLLQEIADNGGVFKLHDGDFIRGIGEYKVLSSSLNTGNVSKEFLGSILGTSSSDTTPLDVDITRINKEQDIYHCINGTPTGFNFGNLFVVIKKDNPCLNMTRDAVGNLTNNPYDPRKAEVFGTQVGVSGYETHWGIRTGISFADVDCIIYKKQAIIDSNKPYNDDGSVNYTKESLDNCFEDLSMVKFEIARNGYYIPVVDFSGKLIYTEDEYNELREKMGGLRYYGVRDFKVSNNVSNPEISKISEKITIETLNETTLKRGKVEYLIAEVLRDYDLDIKTYIDGDLKDGVVEFIDTGSTGRNTNVPHDGDFDFYMRLDNRIMGNSELLGKIKKSILEKFKEYPLDEEPVITGNGDFRIKGVHLDEETCVDVDISFGVKTNKIHYSSDESLKDRLSTIRDVHPDNYRDIIANIILAKLVFKHAGAYKSRSSREAEGGFGGIGVENWILENGGSFIDAANSFLNAAIDQNGNLIDYDKFVEKYQVWDFGENHFSARKNDFYLFDNFVRNNISAEGFKKMADVLNKCLDRTDPNKLNTEYINDLIEEYNQKLDANISRSIPA